MFCQYFHRTPLSATYSQDSAHVEELWSRYSQRRLRCFRWSRTATLYLVQTLALPAALYEHMSDSSVDHRKQRFGPVQPRALYLIPLWRFHPHKVLDFLGKPIGFPQALRTSLRVKYLPLQEQTSSRSRLSVSLEHRVSIVAAKWTAIVEQDPLKLEGIVTGRCPNLSLRSFQLSSSFHRSTVHFSR